jgi:hypothetical protein
MIHAARISYLLHNKHEWVFIPQPLSALLFLGYCLLWLLNDSFWIATPSRSGEGGMAQGGARASRPV